MRFLSPFLAWLFILALAAANGALREAVLVPSLGRTGGLLLSGVLLSLIVVIVACFLVRARRGLTVSQGFGIGVFWLVLTLAFELGFGLFQHKSWADLLGAYTFEDGNLWPVVLLATLLAPPTAALLQARSRRSAARP